MIHSETPVIDGCGAYPRTLQLRDRGADIYAPQPVQAELRKPTAYPANDKPRNYGDDAVAGQVLREYVPTADDLDGRTQYIVDGTLLPCWSWASHPELYSGKHKTTGMNVQVVCTFSGGSRGFPTRWTGADDTYCLSESGALLTLDPGNWWATKAT